MPNRRPAVSFTLLKSLPAILIVISIRAVGSLVDRGDTVARKGSGGKEYCDG